MSFLCLVHLYPTPLWWFIFSLAGYSGVQRAGENADSSIPCWSSAPLLSFHLGWPGAWAERRYPVHVFANLGPRESCTLVAPALVAPAGCPPASKRAPEPVPGAGSGFYRLRPARAGAGGRDPHPSAGGLAGGEACPGRARASGPQGRQVLRALPESSAGAIGSGARPGEVSQEVCARAAARKLCPAAGNGNAERERPPGARTLCARPAAGYTHLGSHLPPGSAGKRAALCPSSSAHQILAGPWTPGAHRKRFPGERPIPESWRARLSPWASRGQPHLTFPGLRAPTGVCAVRVRGS